VLKTPADPPPPPPVLGKSVDAAPVSGLVFFKLPAKKAHSALVKGTDFVPLTEARQLPVGTQVDARQGTLRLVSAAGVRHRTYAGDFSRGLFQILQGLRRKARGLTTLKLIENAFPGAPSYNQCTPLGKGATAAKAKHLSSRVLQLLHASVHGHFQSRGRFSAATVRGTVWDVSDRCDGTLTVVHRGTVLVTDFRRRITVPVTAGKSYLARAP
jgi:hypothetical protein